MHLPQLEYRALRSIDTVRKGTQPEDDGVELKREMPADPQQVARRIAGMANASGGAEFVWVIGIDGKTGEYFPVALDLATWWPQVQAWFDGDAPVLSSTHAEGAMVLGFDPQSPPYVVRTAPEKGLRGLPTHEVPWREGTQVRTARHSEMIRILVPIARTPEIEVMRAKVSMRRANSPTTWGLTSSLRLFIAPTTHELVTLPAHRGEFSIADSSGTSLMRGTPMARFSHEDGSTVDGTNPAQLYCKAPGMAALGLGGDGEGEIAKQVDRVIVRGSIRPVPDAPPARFVAELTRLKASSEHVIWRLGF